jgi:peptidoglycan/xylan/chitin deacetylase (PgdA/CDA1 family)
MSTLRQAARRFLAPLLPSKRLLISGAASSGAVAVTFDDGPDARQTPRVLELLAALGLHATFFLVGHKARALPGLVKRIAAEGHAVGNHTYWHREPAEVSAGALLAEVRDTQSLLEDLTGEACRLFRPPKGRLSVGKLLALWRAGQHIVLWNVDPRDYACQSENDLNAWGQNFQPRAGQIVLLHDDRPWAGCLLPDLAGKCAAAGLAWERIDRWLPGHRRPARAR